MKSTFFSKILLKPIISFITVLSFWLLFVITNLQFISIYLNFIFFVILIFTQLFVTYILVFRILKYLKFKQFPTYTDAENYYQELMKVQKAENTIKKRELEEIKETIKKVKLEKLKEELEIRKKKVL